MSDLVVDTQKGKLRGKTGKNYRGERIYEFLGIPYAKPPTKELRFKPPVPAEPWTGIKDATKPGNISLSTDEITFKHAGSEDCLTLNVYTRNLSHNSIDRKPVMVFIHGGGLTVGSSRRDVYGPEFLLLEDIVLVTLNYRLGVLGFLSVDDPSAGATGNAGLKDQSLALRWVQRNIAHFNGDPNNVTLFGQSAGSSSVHAHILSPMSKGLFHKAIMQSGCCLNSWFWGSKNNAREVVKAMGIQAQTEAEAVKILRAVPAVDILNAQDKIPESLFPMIRRPFSAVVETPNAEAFFSESPVEIMKSGNYNHVPIIIGYTDTEGYLNDYDKFVSDKLGADFPQFDIKKLIPYELNVKKLEDIQEIVTQFQSLYVARSNIRHHDEFTDADFLAGIFESIRLHLTTRDHPIYLYRISINSELNYLKRIMNILDEPGCSHGDDLGYLFHSLVSPVIRPNSVEERAMKNFVKLWTNFARFGRPTPKEYMSVVWHPITDENNLKLLNIDKKLEYKEVPEKERVRLWRNILKKWPYTKYN